MIRPAIWVLEQEYKFVKKHFSGVLVDLQIHLIGYFQYMQLLQFKTAAISAMPYARFFEHKVLWKIMCGCELLHSIESEDSGPALVFLRVSIHMDGRSPGRRHSALVLLR